MGSPLRLTLPGSDDGEADAAWAVVASQFAQAEAALTRFERHSPLSRLNQGTGTWVAAPPLLARALTAAWRAFRATHGRFDPRVIGALEAAGERAGVELPPSPDHLGRDDAWLRLDPRRGRARVSAPIDLGGIAKGLALRWTARTLRGAGHHRFLIAAGGDVVAAGLGPANRPWVVGIEDPADFRRTLDRVELVDAAVATSSVAVRSWRGAGGRFSHHLIDPGTLAPAPPVWSSVTVVHGDPAWAEVHSKVGFLAGRDVARALGGRRSWWVDPSGRFHAAF